MKNIIYTVLFAFSTAVSAGATNGAITNLTVNVNGEANIQAGAMSSLAACATLGYYVVDVKTDAGRAMYSMLLSAFAQNKSVYIKGKDVCDIRVDSESVQYVRVVN